jgi:hypothetical protein
MSKLTPFALFIRQCLLYPLQAPFLPPEDKVLLGFEYAAGQKIGSRPAGVPPGLPKTGQSDSIVDFDDGYYKKGLTILDSRYIDNGKNTITDLETDLEWIKDVRLIIPDGLVSNNTGNDKTPYAPNTTLYAGDVLLDPIDETAWTCLITHQTIQVSAYQDDHDYFDGDYVSESDIYYKCHTDHHSNGATIADDIVNTSADWQTIDNLFSEDRDNNDGQWQQNLFGKDDGSGNLYPNSMAWSYIENELNAIDLGNHSARGIVKNGHSDWRLPNIFELASILDISQAYSPKIRPIFFPQTPGGFTFSSTIDPDNHDNVFGIDFGNGNLISVSRSMSGFCRPVRSIS